MSNNREDSCSYKIAHGCSFMVFNLLGRILRMIWTGIKTVIKNKILIAVFLSIAIVIGIVSILLHDVSIFIMMIILFPFFIGLWQYIKDRPKRKQRKYFNNLFQQIGLTLDDDSCPCYLYHYDKSEFVTVIAFNSFIPLDEWMKKKDQIEIYMDVKIVDIRQDENNYRVINLVVQREQLPSMVNWDDDYIDEYKNVLNIGVDYYGLVGMNLSQHPHAFIAGETGSGKSNILKCLIHQSIIKGYDVILIDFKRGVSFSSFGEVVNICYDYTSAMKLLKSMVEETVSRLDTFREARVDNIKDYNEKTGDYLHRKIIFIDELAELLKTRDKEISNILNDCIETLTRLSRAVGIHLIMGIQRPDSTIISGQIKNNVSYRVCGRFVDKEPSRIMLGDSRASTIPNIKGRFIVKDDDYHEVQCFYFTDDNVPIKRVPVALETVKEQQPAQTPSDRTMPKIAQEKKQEEIQVKPMLTDELDFDFSDIGK